MPEIPSEVVVIDNQGDIPKDVAELSQDEESPEGRPYLISFAKYKNNLCEISLLNTNKAKKAIEVLKTVGTKIKNQADFQRNYFDRIPIADKGEYKKLYNGLSADIQLREIKLQQSARIFYFDIEPERTFYVVAITENHFETNQVRR
jgi:hypothetical protein